jgi:ABC-2 type transport system ATP-binding protein
VSGIDFSVDRGEVFGFLGPNGAGKSTTVRMLTGFLPPTAGRIAIAGYDLASHPVAARYHCGVLPEEANTYADLTVWQNVMLMAELHGLRRQQGMRNGMRLLELFGLSDRARQKSRHLSKGLRQRLMLCMALVSDPILLFLDEPTSGLDVASARLIREVIVRLNRDSGTTVFLTTHDIDEADELCHRVAIIDRGKIAVIDTPRSLRGMVHSRRSVEVRFAPESAPTEDMLEFGPATETVRLANGYRVFGAEPGRIAQELASRATARGLRVEHLSTHEPKLEDVFLHVISKNVTTGNAHA